MRTTVRGYVQRERRAYNEAIREKISSPGRDYVYIQAPSKRIANARVGNNQCIIFYRIEGTVPFLSMINFFRHRYKHAKIIADFSIFFYGHTDATGRLGRRR